MTTTPQTGPEGEEPTGPVIRDRRRIDPHSGEVREGAAGAADAGTEPAGTTPAGTGGAGEPSAATEEQVLADELAQALAAAQEHRDDLQRLQAEYVNYRRRVERDRDLARLTTIAEVVEALMPVLDEIDLARQHGELTGPFAGVAEKTEAVLVRFGWERFGAVGEEFDPEVHEALMHSHSEDVTGPTVVQVLQPGHRVGERIVRAARVAVADPPA